MRVEDLPDVPRATRRTRWGRWSLANNGDLVHDERRYYPVPAAEIDSATEMLDWIFQTTGKTWCTAEDAGQLLEAIRETAKPQARLCPFAIAHGRETRRAER